MQNQPLPLTKLRRRLDARPLDEGALTGLVASIREMGIINPLRVRPMTIYECGREAEGYEITAGRHRFEAASRLRMPDAPCIIVTEDDINAELAMIDENLCRTDMTLAERARIMARRKELYEEKHPETKNGRNQHTRVGNFCQPSSGNFAASTAAAIGKNERGVRLDVQRGTQIADEALTLVARTPLDNTRYLNGLMRTPKAEQVERVRRDLADPPARTKPTADAAYLAWIEEGQRWLNRGDAEWQARARTTLFPAE